MRLCVIISPPIRARKGLCTVVPLSITAPDPVQAYHCQLDIPFMLPKNWSNIRRWVKGDMVCAVGLHRVNLLRLGKDRSGKRMYQLSTLSDTQMKTITNCVIFGLGVMPLTEN